MSDYYVVPKTALDATADAIRGKLDSEDEIQFKTNGFADTIDEIEVSAFTPVDAVEVIRFSAPDAASAATTIDVDFTKMPHIATLATAFNTYTSAWYVYREIKMTPPTNAIACNGLVYASTTGHNLLKRFVIRGTLIPTQPNNQAGVFASSNLLESIEGFIDLSAITTVNPYAGTNYSNMFYNCSKLETVRFIPGSMAMITTDWNLSWLASLTDASLVSIANALPDTYSGTITFHATPKARLASLMGAVTTEDGLSVFEIDASGTVSLQDFLTTTKGASLA